MTYTHIQSHTHTPLGLHICWNHNHIYRYTNTVNMLFVVDYGCPWPRIEELESGIERLRNHQEILKRKLKKQVEKKTKLEVRKVSPAFTTLHPLPLPHFHSSLLFMPCCPFIAQHSHFCWQLFLSLCLPGRSTEVQTTNEAAADSQWAAEQSTQDKDRGG